ncbi:hypothetical protein ABL849_17265 [Variovorax sp. 375MFSha3.1]|uniref:hypothetical protein n=1 Tax=Variovorax sp. 375MFSha3.1 TaxID=3158364 RepID=UPI003AAB12E8
MDLITHIPGIANSGQFNPGPNTPAPWNVPIVGAVDGNGPANATRNMAEIYNRLLFAHAALVEASGLPIDNADWAQLVHAFRTNGLIYAVGAGAANVQTVSYTPGLKALVDGMVLWFKAGATNTGPATLNVNGLGAKAVVGAGHAPLQGGEISLGGKCLVLWNSALDSFVLVECTGAPLQVAAASQPQHAPQFGQVQSGYGVRGLVGANNAGAPTTQFDWRADLVELRNPVTGATSAVANVATLTTSIATAGPAANGRDQAAAFTPSTWVHFYFIFNPTTSTIATISSATAPPVGPMLPAGYTAWAYAGAVVLSAATQLAAVKYRGAWATYDVPAAILSGSAVVLTPFSTAALVPPNALEYKPLISNFAFSSTAGGVYSGTLFVDSYQVGISGTGAASAVVSCSGGACMLPNAGQSSSYRINIASGSGPTATIQVQGFKVPNGGE